MAHPALERTGELVLQALGHEQEGGRAGSAVEIFVAAADREIAAAAAEIELERACTVRQVPKGERSGGAGRLIGRFHVVERSRPVIDMGEGDYRRVAVDRADHRLGWNGFDGEPEHLR